MLTTTAPPTAVPLVDRPPAAAMFCRPMRFVALRSRSPPEVMFAPWPITAVVWNERTWIATDAATLASDLPPAAANAQTTKSFSLVGGVTASTVIEPPLTTAPGAIEAWFVMSSTFRPTAAPTATSDCMLALKPIALALASIVFWLVTLTAPVALTVGAGLVPLPRRAVVLWRAQLIEMAAAMFTPPLSSPDSLLELLLAESVESWALGRLPSV